MLNEFKNALPAFFQKEDRILIAVSGGLDSMVLLHLLWKANYTIAVAHCNFSLRGKESDEEELFVKDFCSQHTIPFYSKRFSTESYAHENKLSIQLAARKLRYEWFDELANEQRFSKIATAHHLNDAIETFFINVLRKAGPAGLAGIPSISGNIVRPLLSFTRQDISAYASAAGLEWKEDSSNQSDDYLRNRLRHHLIPFLTDSEFENDMRQIMASFSWMETYLKQFSHDWLKHNQAEPDTIPLNSVKLEEHAETMLSTLLHYLGIDRAECDKILKAETGKMFETEHHVLLVDRSNLRYRLKEQTLPSFQSFDSLPFSFKTKSREFVLKESSGTQIIGEAHIQQIDRDLLRFPLTIRTWKEGDRFYPLGMDQPKKISDFLTDIKLSRFEKDYVCVLLSNNDIVCILGHRIDHRYRITKNTQNTLIITQHEF